MNSTLGITAAILLLGAASLCQAGPRFVVSINPGVNCAPRPICPPTPCYRPVTYRSCYTGSPWGWNNWGGWGYNSYFSTSVSFSTTSPLLDYGKDVAVVRVPDPVKLPIAQPVTVYPQQSFGWRN